MRLALISDIHGNDVALEAVAEELERLELDACLCLGDAVQGGAQPAEVVARLRELGCPVVMGNGDHFLLEIPKDSPEPISGTMLEVREWTLSKLPSEGIAFIRSFEPVVELLVEPGTRVFAFHGSRTTITSPRTTQADGRRRVRDRDRRRVGAGRGVLPAAVLPRAPAGGDSE